MSVTNGLVAAGAGVAPVPASLAGHEVSGTRYVPLAGGGVAAWDLHVVTRGDGAGAPDPLAAAFLARLREARDEVAARAPSA